MSALSVVGTTKEGIPVMLLKEGTSETKGKDAIRNNVEAARIVASIYKVGSRSAWNGQDAG